MSIKYRKSASPLKFIIITLICAAVVVGLFFLLIWATGNEENANNSKQEVVSDIVSNNESDIMAGLNDNAIPQISSTLNIPLTERLPDGAKKLITDYNRIKYAALATLEFSSLKEFFDNGDLYGGMYAEFCDTSLDYLIYVRKNRTVDLKFGKADFIIDIKTVEYENDIYTVVYEISEAIDFNCTGGKTSYSRGMVTEAKIKRDGDNFLFLQLAEDTDVNLLIEEKVMNYLGFDYEENYLKDMEIPEDKDYKAVFEGINNKLKETADKDIAAQKKMLLDFAENPDSFKFTDNAEKLYNRTAAVDYSYKWVSKSEHLRNPEFPDYTDYGGNCQNYVSQCILAGGIPMDWDGGENQQWKWFDNTSNTYNEAAGRSTSWAGTEAFYLYCINNEGKGLKAKTDINIYSAKVGDIMQYVVDDWAHHSVIVSDIIYDESGNPAELLINSNTTDRIDYPLTAYGYTTIRGIHIIGC